MGENNIAYKRYTLLYLVFLVVLSLFEPAYAQQIVVDGKTATVVTKSGSVTDVSTTTVKNKNAFNSFEKFNVKSGQKVNLHLPDKADNLINLVHSEKSVINGTLNSIKNNQVGGNVYLVNPHGVTVGPEGTVNVGSLTAITPTKEYMNSFFTSPGNPNTGSVESLLNGTAPINPEASIEVQGNIYAIENVKLDTGSVVNTGNIRAGPEAREHILSTEDIVNTGGYENSTITQNSQGEIIIKAQKDILNNGLVSVNGIDNNNAGNITITAKGDITLEKDSYIAARGQGENSSGGDIYIFADDTASFDSGAIIDFRGGDISGDGGFAELSAAKHVLLNGGTFLGKAVNGINGSALIDPPDLTISNDETSDGANLTFQADDWILVESGVTISSRNISGSDHLTDPSQGNSGSITFDTQDLTIQSGSYILSFADGGYDAGEIHFLCDTLSLSSPVNSGAATTYLRKQNDGNINIASVGYISAADLSNITADTIQIGNYGGTFETKHIQFYEAVTTSSNLILRADNDIIINSAITAGSINGISGSGLVNINGNITSTGNIDLEADNTLLVNSGYTIDADGYITLKANGPDTTSKALQIDPNVTLNAGGNITLNQTSNTGGILIDSSELISGGTISIDSNNGAGYELRLISSLFHSNGNILVNSNNELFLSGSNTFRTPSASQIIITSNANVNIVNNTNYFINGDLEITTPADIYFNSGNLLSTTSNEIGTHTIEINLSGNIDAATTITADYIVDASNVEIPNLILGGGSGDINLNASNILGTGFIQTEGSLADLTITNNSNKNLILNDITLTFAPAGDIFYNGTRQPDGVPLGTVNVNISNSGIPTYKGELLIQNAGTGDIVINGTLRNESGINDGLIAKASIDSSGNIETYGGINAYYDGGLNGYVIDPYSINYDNYGTISILSYSNFSGPGTIETVAGNNGIEIFNENNQRLYIEGLLINGEAHNIIYNNKIRTGSINGVNVNSGANFSKADIKVTSTISQIVINGNITNHYRIDNISNKHLEIDEFDNPVGPVNIDYDIIGDLIVYDVFLYV
jgi:filamentous hemagglutinin family protein